MNSEPHSAEHARFIAPTRRWVEQVVIELNLCPFARRELVRQRVRFRVSEARTEAQLLVDLQLELDVIARDEAVSTTLLIHPFVLQDFYDYNQFLDAADGLLVELALEGVIQIASFHPDYRFSGTLPEDAQNYTNRSPHPMLHLLREDSLSEAIASYPQSDQIAERNIELTESLGKQKLAALLQSCR